MASSSTSQPFTVSANVLMIEIVYEASSSIKFFRVGTYSIQPLVRGDLGIFWIPCSEFISFKIATCQHYTLARGIFSFMSLCMQAAADSILQTHKSCKEDSGTNFFLSLVHSFTNLTCDTRSCELYGGCRDEEECNGPSPTWTLCYHVS